MEDLEDLDYNLNDILQYKKYKGLNPRIPALKSVWNIKGEKDQGPCQLQHDCNVMHL